MSWTIDLRLRRGEFSLDIEMEGDDTPVAIIGPNGAGKTTLLRSICGGHSTSEGCLKINGRDLLTLPAEQRRIGYLPQGFGLFPHLTAFENVAFGNAGNAEKIMEEMQCSELRGRRPAELSGGEKQKIALARALATAPDLLLLDEPLSALDISARRIMREYLVATLKERAIPTLVVTHDIRDVIALDSRVYVVEHGAILQSGTAHSLTSEPKSEFVREFFS